MGADNWGHCPKCKFNNVVKIQKLQKKIEEGYGEISFEKYKELEVNLKNLLSNEDSGEMNLREDYEFYLDKDGYFIASYEGSCKECGFRFDFRHEEQVEL